MPFTLSHTAAVLPFARLLARWRLLSATVIGAMVPDFGLFLPSRPARFETHSAMALFSFCLPVGLATYWVFQRLIKTPVLEVLPDGAYARSRPFAEPAELSDLRQWALAACGVLAGAVTHLVWDGFTHEGARGVRMLPVLDDPLVEFGTHHVVGTRLMQDGSSLLGLVVVMLLVGYALRRGGAGEPAAHRRLRSAERRWWLLAYAAAAIALSGAWFALSRLDEPSLSALHPVHALMVVANGLAVAALRGLASALIGVSAVLSLHLRAPR